MSYLSKVRKKGDTEYPFFVVLYGPPGVGKTSFGASSPEPLIVDGERGTLRTDSNAIELPGTLNDLYEMLSEFGSGSGTFPYKTLVIDPLSEVERLVWNHVVASARKTDSKVETIEDVGGGFGKGYYAADEHWRKILHLLEAIRANGVNLLIIDHERIAKFKNPAGDDWLYFRPAVHDRAAALFAKKCEALLYAHKTISALSAKGKKTVGISDEVHILSTQGCASFEAKNRFGLPPEFPLSWDEFWTHYTSPDTPAKMKQKILSTLAELGDDSFGEKVKERLVVLTDMAKLRALLNTINIRIGGKQG